MIWIWQNYHLLAPWFLILTFSSGVAGAICKMARRRGSSFSAPRRVTSPLVRWGETLLWALAAGLLLLPIVWGYEDWLSNPNSIPEVFEGVRRRLLYAGGALGLAVLAAATRHQGLAGLGFIALWLGMAAPWWGSVYEWPEVVAAVRNSPMPFKIPTPPDLPQVSVSVNDVALGTTPIVTTWEKIKESTPVWKVEPEFHRQADRGTLLWRHFHFFASEPGADKDRDADLFLRFRLGDTPLYLYAPEMLRWSGFPRTNFTGSGGSNQGARVHAQIMPIRMDPTLTVASWGDEVLFLLHRARLADYFVDESWCAAFESYALLGETALGSLKAEDAGLQSVGNALAMRRHSWLANRSNESEAWERLLELIDAAGRRGEIRLSGIDGAALRQLARQISDETFARRVAAELDRPVRIPGISIESHGPAGKVSLIKISGIGDRLNEPWLRGPVLRQLAIERDAALDAAGPQTDNPIETYVTPALMRHGQVGDGSERIIGGHLYEQVLWRHDWRDLTPKSSRFEDTLHLHGTMINRWLLRLAELDSAFGRDFRWRNRDRLWELADEIWRHQPYPSNVPEELGFLFLDHRADLPSGESERRTLAELFWPTFLKHRTGDKRTDLQLQWDYLARMSPDSQPEQFVRALAETNPDWLDILVSGSLKLMPPASCVEMLQAVLDDLERQSTSGKYPPSPREYSRDRHALIASALTIDHPDMARIYIQELDRSGSTFGQYGLLSALHQGHVPLAVMQKLAECDRPTVRKMVAETGLYRTDPASRRLIELLGTDADDSVRTAAQAILRQWAEWKARPLPSRTLPVAAAPAE